MPTSPLCIPISFFVWKTWTSAGCCNRTAVCENYSGSKSCLSSVLSELCLYCVVATAAITMNIQVTLLPIVVLQSQSPEVAFVVIMLSVVVLTVTVPSYLRWNMLRFYKRIQNSNRPLGSVQAVCDRKRVKNHRD